MQHISKVLDCYHRKQKGRQAFGLLQIISTPGLLQGVVHCQLFQNFGLTRLADFSGQEHFIHNGIYLVEVEDKIELTNIMKILIEDLNKVVYGLQVVKIVIIDVHTDAEVEAGIATVHNLEVSKLNKVGVFGISHSHNCMNFFYQLLLLFIVKVHVPLGQPGLARPVLDHHEPDHRCVAQNLELENGVKSSINRFPESGAHGSKGVHPKQKIRCCTSLTDGKNSQILDDSYRQGSF